MYWPELLTGPHGHQIFPNSLSCSFVVICVYSFPSASIHIESSSLFKVQTMQSLGKESYKTELVISRVTRSSRSGISYQMFILLIDIATMQGDINLVTRNTVQASVPAYRAAIRHQILYKSFIRYKTQMAHSDTPQQKSCSIYESQCQTGPEGSGNRSTSSLIKYKRLVST